MKIREGRCYWTRAGNVVGPIAFYGTMFVTYRGETWYRDTGQFYCMIEDPRDLVREMSDVERREYERRME